MMILGISLVTIFFVAWYWYYSNIYILKMPLLEQLFSDPYLVWLFLLGGPILLIVGVWGVDIPLIKKYRGLVAIAVPIFVSVMFCYLWIGALNYSFANSFAVRSEITHLTVVSTNPLVLSLNVKAITDYDSRIESAIILNSNNDIVAEISKREYIVSNNWQGLAMAVLPAGSEITLTLDFNKTLPSGNYLVRLTAWEMNHGSAPFTIP